MRRHCAAAVVIGVFAAVQLAGLSQFGFRRFPQSLSNVEFRRLVGDLSEPGGSFHTDNFVSNEMALSDAILTLQDRGLRGGVYMGVGPEQNFSYIVALQPEAAFIVDIRRQNMLQHLLYKALAELSPNRTAFLSRLFSRPPPNVDSTELPAILNALRKTPAPSELFDRHLTEVLDCLKIRHGLPLNAGDERTIRSVYGQFRAFGPDITYAGVGPWPTFAEIVTAPDRTGISRTFLSTEERYRTFKSYEERNLIVPIVGDFAGPQAIRRVGEYVRSRGAVVTSFYLSNVEQYLFPARGWQKFYENAGTLPLDERSVFIRSFPAPFANGGRGGRPTGGTVAIGPVQALLDAVTEGRIKSYSDLSALSAAPGFTVDSTVLGLLESYTNDRSFALPVDDPEMFRERFKSTAAAWADAAPPNEKERRQQVVALAALEAAHASVASDENSWSTLKHLVEWACDRLRDGTPTEFDRDWMLASIALGARAGDQTFLALFKDQKCQSGRVVPCNHARHAAWTFPDDGRFALAVLMARPELRVQSNRPGVPFEILVGANLPKGSDRRKAAEERVENSLQELVALSTDPRAGHEARLRAGVLRFHRNDLAGALADFSAVVATATDTATAYMAHLYSGLTFDAQQRPDAAIAEYRAALRVLPGARSAATALATHLVAQDQAAEALSLIDTTFTSTSPPDDPWYRFAESQWPSAILRLRQAVRR